MREILFRGKRSDCGEWIYGYYFKADKHWHGHGIHEDWIATSSIQNGGWCNISGKYPVISETIGQYTGVTDRNGNKIFEGDIVKLSSGVFGFIKYDSGMFRCVGKTEVKPCVGNINQYIKVVGNIYDNSELLEGGDEE